MQQVFIVIDQAIFKKNGFGRTLGPRDIKKKAADNGYDIKILHSGIFADATLLPGEQSATGTIFQ